MKYLLETYGCQMNSAESAAMEHLLAARGWVACTGAPAGSPRAAALPAADCDLVIINTCAVRATAEQRLFGRLAYYAALKKEAGFAIAITGCAAASSLAALLSGGADFAIGPAEKHHFEHMLAGLERRSCAGGAADGGAAAGDAADVFARRHSKAGEFSAYVPIMHGCDNFCSYCIVPYVRGREVSRPAAAILAEITALAGEGAAEITLLGQNVNAYNAAGADGGAGAADFPALLRRIARQVAGTSIRWVRFLSSHPKDVSDELIEVLAEHDCFCRHIHLPVQHGSDKILSAMNRRYTRAGYLERVAKLRAALPGLTLSTDILTGFPGETEEDFEQILSLMDEVRFSDAFTYYYNPRAGTAAFNFENQIAPELKRARLARVIALQREHTKAAREAALGEERLVLVSGPSRKNRAELLCRGEHEEMCVVPAGQEMAGRFVRVRYAELSGVTFRALGKQ
ncbi:MAG: tRNA (N6-isopentenyl adenosine(37)-C2)-methylthiotransferase MiaB [Spirochaetaceae bacterium]|nr:tRNA (N6-isopentenyl adenosine(37)-C2)-methylthiotransferase MiaB [Spirochaetaceae bacterium]